MTLLELVTELRNKLDDKGGHLTDWELAASSNLLRWTNDELVLLINESEREVCRRIPLLVDGTTEDVVQIDVEADESLYLLNSVITRVLRAKTTSNDKVLNGVSWRDLEGVDDKWDTRTGTVLNYILDWDTGYLKLQPTPTTTDTISMRVNRMPLDALEWTNREWQEPEIPTDYHYKMLHWALHLAYEKDEPNTLDRGKSEYHRDKFEYEFGPKENVYSQERKKRVKRPIKYGGL